MREPSQKEVDDALSAIFTGWMAPEVDVQKLYAAFRSWCDRAPWMHPQLVNPLFTLPVPGALATELAAVETLQWVTTDTPDEDAEAVLLALARRLNQTTAHYGAPLKRADILTPLVIERNFPNDPYARGVLGCMLQLLPQLRAAAKGRKDLAELVLQVGGQNLQRP